jgi:hypothetical protein
VEPKSNAGHRLADRLRELLGDDGRTEPERARLVELMLLFAQLPPPPDPGPHFPDYERLHGRFVAATAADDGDELEERFLELYCHLHMFEAPYTARERGVVDATGGYWCHAGGLSPILRAVPFLGPGSVSADYGAGNGLQGLLIQRLAPHARTVQIEISAEAVAIGRRLQAWLGVAAERVEWINDDVRSISPRDLDFVYIYRPLHPVGPGDEFYRWFADELDRAERPVVVFSVADCLRSYLSPRFEVLSSDGHLTCFRGPVPGRSRADGRV